jgi:iron complex outermembrane receptor protein
MFKLNKLYIILLLLAAYSGSGQNCNLTITGQVLDEHTGYVLPGTNVVIEELNQGAAADSNGMIIIKGLCPGEYHLRTTHIGCETKKQYLELTRDTFVYLFLHHHEAILSEVVISAERVLSGTQAKQSIDGQQLVESANKDLSNILSRIAGVSTIKNGGNISKPVIHGLYGNRIAILNNGIAQSGQQWGNDHAPEIDPMAAERISVIKGVGTLAYNGNSLGGVVVVEPGIIENEPHLHGQVNYIFDGNGRGHTGNIQLSKHYGKTAWKATGTLKYAGDRSAPNYYLTNTGTREANVALQVERKLSDKWHADFYYSLFNTTIGVLRGSHIGNLTDLDQALQREEPFFTSDHFSYNINAPKQEVQHHLLKIKLSKNIREHLTWNLFYGGQWNNRKEFDVRRQNFTDRPALSLRQFTNYFETNLQKKNPNSLHYQTGLQVNIIDNQNIPETNVFPLVPDYVGWDGAYFITIDHKKNRLGYEAGARYEYKHRRVAALTRTNPIEIRRYENTFHNYSFSGGMSYLLNDRMKSTINTGLISRNPAVNELYSNGLHQGVSGIELGNPDIRSEKSIKTTIGVEAELSKKLFINVLGYLSQIRDYIYLRPEEEVQLTIRGAFPVFSYDQTDAQISGLDLMIFYEMTPTLNFSAKYAYIKGRDRKNDIPLINIPASSFEGSVGYEIAELGQIKNIRWEVSSQIVTTQDEALSNLDFAAVPDGYFLLGAKLSGSLEFFGNELSINIQAENLLNNAYRDYLNRQRYFSDDLGRNISLGLNYKF